ncbi:MAG: N-acetylmuramoyl-L-alanine amidase [Actinomycetota bacterium]|nr:N-acetylmuramoyl-L-alanine amidase [Actinomycetota bacterium]
MAVVAAGGADLTGEPQGPPFVRAYQGLVLAVEGRQGDWLLVRTPCDTSAWVSGSQVSFTPEAQAADVGAGFDFAEATVVLDPGHGGPNRGAVGPAGLVEAVVNLDIARRARDLLQEPHSVDWETGVVGPGDDIPAVGSVWLTRTEGPPGADYEAGLLFRTRLANMAGAHAFVSVHNNADPDGPFRGPGSEVFYSVKDGQSKRLAGILIEELRRGFRSFQADWVGDTDAGAKHRLQDDGRTDYYGVLRRAQVPAVIAEGAFISNPDEEALLGTPEFRQAYAEAVYRALVRFLTTDDPGSGYTDPYPRTIPAGSGAPLPTCRIPQP